MLAQHALLSEAYNLLEEAKRIQNRISLKSINKTRVERIDYIVERFGKTKLNNRVVCKQLVIQDRHFETPSDLLAEIVIGYQRARLSNQQIIERLRRSPQLLSAYKEAISHHVALLTKATE